MIGQFVHPVEVEGVKGVSFLKPATSFTLFKYRIICCKIKVIINPFNQNRFSVSLLWMLSFLLCYSFCLLSYPYNKVTGPLSLSVCTDGYC